MGGPSFGHAAAQPRAPTTKTTTAHGPATGSAVDEGGPPVAFEDGDPEPPPLVDYATVREILDGRFDLELFGGTDVSDEPVPPASDWEVTPRGNTSPIEIGATEPPPPIGKTIVRHNPLARAGHGDRTEIRSATSTPGAPATNRPRESSAFSRPEPPTQPQTWRDDADGGTAVYRASGSGAPGSAVGFRPPGTPTAIDERGSTEAMTLECGLIATIIGAYLSDDEDGRTLAVPDAEPLELGRRPDSPFFDDPFVERYHAALTPTPDGVRVDDFSETNGVYVRVDRPIRIRDGSRIIIGRNVLRFVALPPARPGVLGCPNPGWWGRLDSMIGADVHAWSHPLRLAETILGSDPEATIRFDAATGVVGSHCRIRRDSSGSTVLDDLGSGHGTFVRADHGALLPHDCQILVGRTLVRLERLTSDSPP